MASSATQSSSSSPSLPAQSSDLEPIPTKKITIPLDNTNYLMWRQQVLLHARARDLQPYLDGTISIPPKTIADSSGDQVPNPAYKAYIRQDSALAYWLLSGVSQSVLPQLVGYESARQIWNQLERSFAQKSASKAMHYRRLLHSMKKGDTPMREYIDKVKTICDNLTGCGQTLSTEEHIFALLNGLPSEFEPVVAIIYANPTFFDLDAVTAIFTDAEARQRDSLVHATISANLTLGQPNPSVNNTHSFNSESNTSTGYSNPRASLSLVRTPNLPWGRGRGRYPSPRIQCQLCGKANHLANRCFFRYDHNYMGSTSNF